MTVSAQIDIPQHLQVFAEDKPSSRLKLLAAWSGLSDESLICVLNKLLFGRRSLDHEIVKCALNHQNPYIRYLGARGFYYSYREEKRSPLETELYQQVCNDSSELVKSTQTEVSRTEVSGMMFRSSENLKKFFALSQVSRLEMIANKAGSDSILGSMEFSDFAEILEKYIKEKNISDNDINDLVQEFCASNACSKANADRWDAQTELQRIWHLAPKLPFKSFAHIVQHLPIHWRGRETEIFDDEFIKFLKERKYWFAALLERKDEGLQTLRKKIIFSDEFNENITENDLVGDIREYATSYVALSDNEFGNALKKYKDQSVLIKLFTNTWNLSLSQYAFLKDVCCAGSEGDGSNEERQVYLDGEDYISFREEKHILQLQSCNKKLFELETADLKTYKFTKWLVSELKKSEDLVKFASEYFTHNILQCTP